MKILVFGNILLKEDNLALKLIPKLRKHFPKFQFKEFDPTENLEDEIENKKLFILDVVKGIDKIVLIEKIEQICLNKVYSMHDFDLAYNLKLLKKIGKINSVKIIGIPMYISEENVFSQLQSILRKCAAQDMQGS